jgi:hypothetical protein
MAEFNAPLSEAFYLICCEEQSTASIEAIRNKALAKIAEGEGKTLISSSLNGKAGAYQVSTPASDVFVAASHAIRRFNSGQVTVIETSFGC